MNNNIESLKQKKKELEEKLALNNLQKKVKELERKVSKPKRFDETKVEVKEGLSESELAELTKAYERVNFMQSNIRNSVSFPDDKQMQELEDAKLSFGEKLAKYSSQQKVRTEITDEMIKHWEGMY